MKNLKILKFTQIWSGSFFKKNIEEKTILKNWLNVMKNHLIDGTKSKSLEDLDL